MNFWNPKQKDRDGELTPGQMEEVLRATIEGAPEFIAVEDQNGRYLAFNKAYRAEFKKVFGVDLELGSSMIEALAHLPNEQKAAAELLDRTLRGEDFTITHEFGDERLARRTYALHCFPIYDNRGRLMGGTHIARDITAERLTQEALRASQQNNQRFIECSPDCLKVLDLEGRVLSVNPGGQKLMELEAAEQFVGKSWLDTWPGDGRALAATAIERARGGAVTHFRAPGLTIKNNAKWWDETLIPILGPSGEPERLLVIARDITEQKKAEDELRRSEEEFRTFFESASGGKAECNPEAERFLRVNEMFCNMTGYSQDELVGMHVSLVIHPDDRDWQMELYRRYRDSDANEYTAEKRFLRKDGSEIWVQVNAGFLRDENGKAYRSFAVFQDISEIKRTQDELRAAKEQAEEGRNLLEALMENVPEGIAIADANEKIRMVSRHGRDVYSIPKNPHDPQAVVGNCKFLNPDGLAEITFDELPLIRAMRRNEVIQNTELILEDAAGGQHWLLLNAAPTRDANGNVTGGIVAWHEVSERKHAEETVSQERGFLRQVIDAAPSMIFVKDWDGRFILANEALATCYGTTIDGLIGKTDADFNTNQDEVEHFLNDDREVMRTCREKFIPEERVTFANGEAHWFSTIKVPLTKPDGSCDRLLGVASDITQRKQAEEAVKRFRIALDSAADNIFLIDPETMRYLDVSQSACRDLGFSREELLTLGPTDIMPQISSEQLRRQFDEIRSDPTGKGIIETVHYRKDCSGFQVEVVLRPVEIEGRPLLVAVARDITERKQAEMSLKRANEQLAEADHRKDEFLAMLAHELRNPLAPIRNAAKILQFAASEEPVLQRQRDVIDRQVSHMARLLDDLLDVSRITHGNINLKKQIVDLADIFARAVESANPLIEARHHSFTVSIPDGPLRVFGDFDRLIQIVGNLLSNAAKYTEEHGQIWLEAERDGKEIVIRVRDTGVGIAPEMLPKIFDVFTQVDRSLDRAQGGLGLGLSLVRSLSAMHGGRAEAHSEGIGKGSEFVVRLPALPEESVSNESAGTAPSATKTHTHRILVVDDVVDTTNSLAELLSLFGHEVRMAYDGTSALPLAREFRPDVILLDIGLPGENGYEVARRIRRDPMLKGVTLVALTGYGQEEDRRLAREAGFDHLFTKPVELGALQTLLV